MVLVGLAVRTASAALLLATASGPAEPPPGTDWDLQAVELDNLDSWTRGRGLGYDFAVAEECGRWRECGAYVEDYGRHVLVVEYGDGATGVRRWC